jgi:hypothetical protein
VCPGSGPLVVGGSGPLPSLLRRHRRPIAPNARKVVGTMTEPNASPILAGDTADTDAETIDNQVEQMADTPSPDDLPTTNFERPDLPEPMSRLVTATKTVAAAWGPVLLLPADARRKSLQVWAASDTPTDYVRIADDPGKTMFLDGAAALYSGQALSLPSAHTGPVWVNATGAAGPVTVSVMAVSGRTVTA